MAEQTNRDHSSSPPFAMLYICLVPESNREVCIDVEDLSYEELLKWHSKRPMNSYYITLTVTINRIGAANNAKPKEYRYIHVMRIKILTNQERLVRLISFA